MWRKNGFTLIELIISITISAIVLIFLFGIVANVIRDIQFSIARSKLLTQINTYVLKMNNYSGFYIRASILQDYTSGSGSDVLMMLDPEEKNGVLFGVINPETGTLDTPQRSLYANKKYMWYRELSQAEIIDLQSNPDNVYNYTFPKDKWLSDIIIKDYQVAKYNSGALLDIEFLVNQNFLDENISLKYSNIWDQNIEKFIFNF